MTYHTKHHRLSSRWDFCAIKIEQRVGKCAGEFIAHGYIIAFRDHNEWCELQIRHRVVESHQRGFDDIPPQISGWVRHGEIVCDQRLNFIQQCWVCESLDNAGGSGFVGFGLVGLSLYRLSK